MKETKGFGDSKPGEKGSDECERKKGQGKAGNRIAKSTLCLNGVL